MGGTGTIGSAVVRELTRRGHQVVGLARSRTSVSALQKLGASVLFGDSRDPMSWLERLPEVDGVIHAASDFGHDMGDVDTRLLDSLLPFLRNMLKLRFVYTGGCWLYGPTGASPATETSPFNPLPAFKWMVPNLKRILSSTEVHGLAVHPAMVYDRNGGVFSSQLEQARKREPVSVVGGKHVHWPLVHADDLARLYALALERGKEGSAYNGAAIAGQPVGSIASAIAGHYGGTELKIRIIGADEAAALHGEWARGYAIDQSMSGEKARRELGWRPAHTNPIADLVCQRQISQKER